MKKNKLFKRFLTLVMACLMTFGASASVFAAEPTVAEPVNETSSMDTADVVPLNDTQAIILDNIASGASKSDTGYLDHYIGLTKRFECHLTTYGSTSGSVSVVLYKPNGQTATSFSLSSSNPSYSKTFTLPSSGDWRMVENDKIKVTK